ncbi:MAG: DUF4982 domain-containing protein [Bacteroidetes bacterium]|nr:DUF4982 domain-containing protein [Bacteroidota bacterium]
MQGQECRIVNDFNKQWQFVLGDTSGNVPSNSARWQVVNLPHDWSIEGPFRKEHPATPGGGALPGGIGWYKKIFRVPEKWKTKKVWIEFDGVYRNPEVWVNDMFVGRWRYGYTSFRFELTKYVRYEPEDNRILVKVDNSKQPNSRWYSGSGIYRNVRLVVTEKVYVEPWGVFITTPTITTTTATIRQQTIVRNETEKPQNVHISVDVLDANNRIVATKSLIRLIEKNKSDTVLHDIIVQEPQLWSLERPNLYKTRTRVVQNGYVWDEIQTPFGIRYFYFDPLKGFFLNGKHVKINGVCNHHDLGCLGAAIYPAAIERQLRLLKEMGCNAIRTSHNPPAPELLDLCDRMGFLVMDEAFDVWKIGKTKYDYSLDWDEWYEQDLRAMVLRDRNHPSVIVWSIGNEVMEQWDKNESLGVALTKKLTSIIKELDPTRPITAACNRTDPENPIIKAGALDIIGYNYGHETYASIPMVYPGKPFIATETVSALTTRGRYDMPSDSIRRWPPRWDVPLTTGNPDNTCSAYDNCSTPWGSTHRETWRVVRAHDYVSGMFVWTGFDYLGEPTPYDWPSRSSYFGILDLAGFPKDVYYFYKSEWTNEPVLHVFPHWNWKEGDIVDVWVYTNCDVVELFVNGKSVGKKKKGVDDLHLQWRVQYAPGMLMAKGMKGNRAIVATVATAYQASQLRAEASKPVLVADGKDLAFITISVLDDYGTLVPTATHSIKAYVDGSADLIAMDNGLQTSHEPFHDTQHCAFNGLCLAVVRAREQAGKVRVRFESEGLRPAEVTLRIVRSK